MPEAGAGFRAVGDFGSVFISLPSSVQINERFTGHGFGMEVALQHMVPNGDK
jgi:hypothetical protein